MSRFGLTSSEFYWECTPADFHEALTDYGKVHQAPLRAVCKVIRKTAVVIHNSAFGRKRSDMIKDPRRLWLFGWEEEEMKEVQSTSQMKNIMMAIAQNSKPTNKGG